MVNRQGRLRPRDIASRTGRLARMPWVCTTSQRLHILAVPAVRIPPRPLGHRPAQGKERGSIPGVPHGQDPDGHPARLGRFRQSSLPQAEEMHVALQRLESRKEREEMAHGAAGVATTDHMEDVESPHEIRPSVRAPSPRGPPSVAERRGWAGHRRSASPQARWPERYRLPLPGRPGPRVPRHEAPPKSPVQS